MNVYSYPDESGNVCYRTVRTPEKDFRVERPDGQGGWSNGLDGLEPIPYRLPEVLQAIADGLPIYVVEGEKDVDRMFAEGLVATTNPFGAGKWKDHHSDKLSGASLVVALPDNDALGRDHAEDVAASLSAAGVSSSSTMMVRFRDRSPLARTDSTVRWSTTLSALSW